MKAIWCGLFLLGFALAQPQPRLEANAQRNLVYCTADGVELKLDFYSKGPGPSPLVVFVHGGGFTGGSKNQVSEYAQGLLDAGYRFASIDYRLSPRYQMPAHIHDAKCAIRFLRANAERLGVLPNAIGVIGSSAGGHLVAMLGLVGPEANMEGNGGYAGVSSAVQAVVDLFGPTDFTRQLSPANLRLLQPVFGSSDPQVLRRYSPLYWVQSGAPPFLIMHGDQDPVVPYSNSVWLYDALKAAGNTAELVTVKNAGHGFVPAGGTPTPSRAELQAKVLSFFRQYLPVR